MKVTANFKSASGFADKIAAAARYLSEHPSLDHCPLEDSHGMKLLRKDSPLVGQNMARGVAMFPHTHEGVTYYVSTS